MRYQMQQGGIGIALQALDSGLQIVQYHMDSGRARVAECNPHSLLKNQYYIIKCIITVKSTNPPPPKNGIHDTERYVDGGGG